MLRRWIERWRSPRRQVLWGVGGFALLLAMLGTYFVASVLGYLLGVSGSWFAGPAMVGRWHTFAFGAILLVCFFIVPTVLVFVAGTLWVLAWCRPVAFVAPLGAFAFQLVSYFSVVWFIGGANQLINLDEISAGEDVGIVSRVHVFIEGARNAHEVFKGNDGVSDDEVVRRALNHSSDRAHRERVEDLFEGGKPVCTLPDLKALFHPAVYPGAFVQFWNARRIDVNCRIAVTVQPVVMDEKAYDTRVPLYFAMARAVPESYHPLKELGGYSPLELALARESSVNAVEHTHGRSMLALAVIESMPVEFIHQLLERGAVPGHRDHEGRTSLDYLRMVENAGDLLEVMAAVAGVGSEAEDEL